MLSIKGTVWNKSENLLVVPLEKALNETPPSCCEIQMAGNH